MSNMEALIKEVAIAERMDYYLRSTHNPYNADNCLEALVSMMRDGNIVPKLRWERALADNDDRRIGQIVREIAESYWRHHAVAKAERDLTVSSLDFTASNASHIVGD